MAKKKRKIIGSIDFTTGNTTKIGDPEAIKKQEDLAKLRASEKERQVRFGIDPTKYNAFSNLPTPESITAKKEDDTKKKKTVDEEALVAGMTPTQKRFHQQVGGAVDTSKSWSEKVSSVTQMLLNGEDADYEETNKLLKQLKAQQRHYEMNDLLPEEELTEFQGYYNTLILAKNRDILSKTKMDGAEHSVLEEMIAVEKLDGKDKKKRKEAIMAKMEELGIDTANYAIYSGGSNFSLENISKWGLYTVKSGLNSVWQGMAATANSTAGVILDGLGWEDNILDKTEEYYAGMLAQDRFNQQLYASRMSGSKGMEIASEFGTAIVAALPDAILTFLTRGSNKTDLAVKASYEMAGVFEKIGIKVSNLMSKPTFWTSVVKTYGNSRNEAIEHGANETVATIGATLESFINAGLEAGFGFEGLPDELLSGDKNKFWTWVGSSVEEGGEEGLQKFVSDTITKTLYDHDADVYDPLEYAKEMALGTAVGGTLGGVQITADAGVNAYNQYQFNKLDDNEKAVLDKEVENRIAEKEKDGKKLTASEKSAIKKAVESDLRKGAISTDTIEEVLGGETYEAFKQATEKEKAVVEELATLYKGEELQAEVDKFLEGSESVKIKEQLSKEVFGKVKDRWLGESYYEGTRRREKFTADVSKYNEKQREVIQKAIDSGVLNNTRRTHEFVDLIAKISADKGVLFDFVNNERLKKSGFAVGDGKVVNGYVTDDGNVVLNVNAAKSLNKVVGHEITHVLEGTELYGELQTILFDYAKSRKSASGKFDNEYAERLDAVRQLYKGIKGYEGVAGIDKMKMEVAADLVGDYLFTDADFVRNLSTNHRNVFQKIYDEIKYMLNLATAGSKEARELERIKKVFEDAWRSDTKAQSEKKYSLTEVEAVEPTSDAWQRTYTTEEAKAVFPDMWNVAAEDSDVRNPTQITSTVKSYRKIYEFLKSEGFGGTILDASSGLGYGTKAGIEEYGFDVEDIEPYPDKSYNPKYTDYSALDKTYDAIISNAVLNVLPQDQRDALVVKMGEMLNEGGRMFINVRGKDVESLAKTGKNIHLGNMEWIETVKGSYQKGFTKDELVAYLQDALGDGFTVEKTNMFGAVSAIVTKNGAEGGTKYSLTEPFNDSNGTHFENAVLLDTDLFDGISPRNWGAKLREFVYKRGSEDPFILPIEDENGSVAMLQFAHPKDRVKKNDGAEHRVLDELTTTPDNISKLAVVHIDEIVSVSEENSPYFTTGNEHGWLDKNGWLHRNANVINRKNGNIYNLTFDIAKAEDGRTILYATDGKIKKVGNVEVNSLKIKGSRQNSNFDGTVPQEGSKVKKFSLSENIPLEQRLSGDTLLDAEYLVAEPKYSLTEQENAYQYNLENGDMVGAEMAVEEYANLAMPDSKIRDKSGRLIPVYHGTKEAFWEFDTSKKGGINGTAEGFGIYLSDDPEVTEVYGDRQIKMFANITKPATSTKKTVSARTLAKLIEDTCKREAQRMVDDGEYDNVKEAIRDTWVSNYVYTYEMTMDQAYREVAQTFLQQNSSDMEIVQEVMFGMAIRSYDQAMEFYRTSLTPITGFDGFATQWETSGGKKSNIYLAFDSSQLKSADAVTKDDNGNVIPLSERFNPNKKDIRYSLSTDSEGNQLSYEQQEYFKDSKARDSKGNLLKVYHTTNNDFTVFDKSRKGETTGDYNTYLGFFFADTPEYMSQFPEFQSGKTDTYYLNMTNPIDMNNISKEAFLDIVEATGGDVDEAAELYDREYADELKRAKFRGDNSTIMEMSRLLEDLTGEYFDYAEFYNALKPNYESLIAKGYDGFINSLDGRGWANEYIVLDSNQAKLTSNTNPTSNPDIRYSLFKKKKSKYLNDPDLYLGLEEDVDEGVDKYLDKFAEKDVGVDDFDPSLSDLDIGKDGSVIRKPRASTRQDVAPIREDVVPIREDIEPTPAVATPTETEIAPTPAEESLPIVTEETAKTEQNVPNTDVPRTEADMFPDEQVPESDTDFYDRLNSFTDEDAPPERQVYNDQQEDAIPLSKKLADDIRRDVRGSLQVSNRQVADLRGIIDAYANGEYTSREELFADLKKNFGTYTESFDDEVVRDAKSYLRTYGVRVDDYIKHEIADYADLVRRNRGKFRFSNKGTDVDVLYHEMNEKFPHLFPESIIAPTDQLLQMIDVANMDSTTETEIPVEDDAIYEVADNIIRRVSEYRQMQTEKQVNRHSRESFDSLMEDADSYVPPIDPNRLYRNRQNPIGAAENAPEIEQYEDSQGQQAMRFPRQTPPGTTEAVTPAHEIHDTEYKKGVVEGQQAAWEEPVQEKVTRAVLHERAINRIDEALTSEGGLEKVLKDAKNLSTFTTVDNTPQRVFEKAFGRKAGKIISDVTVNAVAQSTTDGIRWINTITAKDGLLDNLVKQYGIKPGTKESAIAQIYAEGFYVDDAGDVVAYGDAQLLRDVPDEDTRSRIQRLVDDPRIRQFYDETLDIINEARVRNGYDPIPRLDNYYLHFRAQTDTFSQLGLPFNPNDIKAKDLPTDLNGMTADLKPGKPYFASEKHRKGLRTTHDLLGGLERYATSAMPQIYYIDHIQTLRALRNHIANIYGQATDLDDVNLSEDDIQAIIQKRHDSHLSTMAKFLNEEANILAGKTALIDRSLEGLFGRRAITFMDTVRKQSGSNQVGLNISSSLTNFEAVARAFAKSNKIDFIKGFSQLASNKIRSIFGQGDTFAEDSPLIVRRKGAERFYRTPWEKIRDVGYVPMGIVDDIATELIARTKYNELIRKRMDSQQAHIETDKWASRLMGDRSLGQMPQIFNSKTMGAILQFQLEVRNTLDSNFYDTIQDANESTEHIKNKLQRNAFKAAKITATFVELAIAQHLFGKAFESIAGYNPTFDIIDVLIKTFGWDDDEEDEDTFKDNLSEGFKALLEDLPYSSTLTGGRIPMSAALPIAEMINGTDQYGNEKAWWKTGLEALPYYFMPTGYGQIKKTAQGLDMFSEEHPIAGSYTKTDAFEDGYQVGDVLDTMLGTSNKGGNMRFPVEDTLGNRIQAGLFGQYANENARYYFDNDIAPMSDKQIAEYAEVDIPIRDYWDYREGLKGKDTLGEKVAYISNLDLPIWKQNILVNNQSSRKEPIDLADYNDYDGWGEFDYAKKYPEKYAFLEANGISVEEFESFDDDTREAYNWAYQHPEKFTMSKAVTDDVTMYKWYTTSLNDIKADKDANGKTISGSSKKKKIAYINSLNLGYEASIVLFKSEYPADDTYNKDIINYIESRADFTFEDKKTILTELGFTVYDDGRVTWD